MRIHEKFQRIGYETDSRRSSNRKLRDRRSIYNDEYQPYYLDGFKDGAEWQAKQSPWISVKERLPGKNTGVFFTVEWKDSCKGYFVGLYYGNGQWESDNRIFLQDSPLYRITHYMPIPSFDEILEANRDVLERIKEKGD